MYLSRNGIVMTKSFLSTAAAKGRNLARQKFCPEAIPLHLFLLVNRVLLRPKYLGEQNLG